MTIEVCDVFHYGDNCANDCNCGLGASTCDPEAGCLCKPGWAGDTCNIDNNECERTINPCNGNNELCINTQGSYSCVCVDGYTKQNGICESKQPNYYF